MRHQKRKSYEPALVLAFKYSHLRTHPDWLSALYFDFITPDILFQTETPFECFYFPNQRSRSAELSSSCDERTLPRYAALPPTRQDQASSHTLLPPCYQPPPHPQTLWTIACVWMHCSTRILLHAKGKKHAVPILFFPLILSPILKASCTVCASAAAKWSTALCWPESATGTPAGELKTFIYAANVQKKEWKVTANCQTATFTSINDPR